ncbi:hypothetical protein [Thiolapillus sp.]|uniref:hypothetical protein n=1 Tax=Thiolapillus sp. TaxID=2017437 RepID=UPI0025EA3466|nr:hypothetical protein [Thiolapillus sp.]
MTRTAGAPIGCQRPSRFWGLGCPKIYHEAEDTLVQSLELLNIGQNVASPPRSCSSFMTGFPDPVADTGEIV